MEYNTTLNIFNIEYIHIYLTNSAKHQCDKKSSLDTWHSCPQHIYGQVFLLKYHVQLDKDVCFIGELIYGIVHHVKLAHLVQALEFGSLVLLVNAVNTPQKQTMQLPAPHVRKGIRRVQQLHSTQSAHCAPHQARCILLAVVVRALQERIFLDLSLCLSVCECLSLSPVLIDRPHLSLSDCCTRFKESRGLYIYIYI